MQKGLAQFCASDALRSAGWQNNPQIRHYRATIFKSLLPSTPNGRQIHHN
jgi:hypothetical protein